MYEGKGLYHHYKGGQYRVLGIGIEEATLKPVVVYEPIDEGDLANLAKLHDGVLFWMRPLDDFNDEVPSEKYGHVPRFVKVAD
jgi:hypothetical protein